MVNGEGNVEYEFLGNPDCPICGPLTGTCSDQPIPPPHENCQCVSVPKCTNYFDSSYNTIDHYGPDQWDFHGIWWIEITCWDGSMIEATIEIDYGKHAVSGLEPLEKLAIDEVELADEMAGECPDCFDSSLVS